MKIPADNRTVSKTEPIRPFCLEYADAKNEVFAAIGSAMQKHNVPLFLMESILSEALHQAKEGARSELQSAADSYQRQLKERSENQSTEE